MDESAWDDVINVNLKGTFLMTQGFARQRLATKTEEPYAGSVVNIASLVRY
jgi:NAD(P)-dependent dehydrogenase (short-subunit alcohol dehydrogenase family)